MPSTVILVETPSGVAAKVAVQGEGGGGEPAFASFGQGAGLSGVGGEPTGRKATFTSMPAVTAAAPFTRNLAFPVRSLLWPP
jgi:hypothetical protein